MTELERIARRLTEKPDIAGTIAAQTLYRVMVCLFEKEPDLSLQGITIELSFIAGFTRGMSDAPENWIDFGRFSQALFDAHYVDKAHESRLMTTLSDALLEMDTTYREQFQVERAQQYLRDIAECACLLIEELDKEHKEQP